MSIRNSLAIIGVLVILLGGPAIGVPAYAPSEKDQQSEDVPPPFLLDYGLQPVEYGSVDFGDYDGDGDGDLVITGSRNEKLYAAIYCRSELAYGWTVGEQAFRDTASLYLTTPTFLASVWQSSAKWGDYDGDGDVDVVVMGITENTPEVNTTIREPQTTLSENRNGIFVQDGRFALPQVFAGEADWGDYDADGDLDLVLTGATRMERPYDAVSVILRNDGTAFTQVNAGLPGLAFGGADWGDFDRDGDLDLALSGELGNGRFHTSIYRNDGGDAFSRLDAGLMPLAFGSVQWGDMEGDGDLDLLVTGGTPDPRIMRGVTKIYRNDDGSFVDHEAALPGVFTGDAIWTDYDVDGLLDIVLAGLPDAISPPLTSLYLQRAGAYEPFVTLGGVAFSDLDAGDYNLDGDPDIVVTGRDADGIPRTHFYQNAVFREWNPFDNESAEPLPGIDGEVVATCIQ